jgi:hypothetical protein
MCRHLIVRPNHLSHVGEEFLTRVPRLGLPGHEQRLTVLQVMKSKRVMFLLFGSLRLELKVGCASIVPVHHTLGYFFFFLN